MKNINFSIQSWRYLILDFKIIIISELLPDHQIYSAQNIYTDKLQNLLSPIPIVLIFKLW